MSTSPREAALHAAATLLRPVASFMLKCGLTWREFAGLAKTAFVAAATDEYGISGRPTNISRVALLCGLARKEVRRQRDLLDAASLSAPEEKTTDATRVLSAWYQDAAYRMPDGRPAILSRDQFNDLCRDYSTEVPASTLLKELLRVGAVAETTDSCLEVRRRYYMPANTDSQWMMTAGHYLADLAGAISHNIDLDNGVQSRFLGRASETRVPVAAADEFRQFLETEGQAFLERVDAWLAERQCPVDEPAVGETVRLGVGVFQIHEIAVSKTELQ